MNGNIAVTFWGVRGSYPAPGTETAQIGGNTTCIQVQAGKHLIILDGGTGVIGLGNALIEQRHTDQKPITATVFFTHTHHDHTQGFPFFSPTHYQSTTLYIFGPKTLHVDLEEVLARAMLPPVFPIRLDELPCVRVICNLHEGESVVLNSDNHEPRVVPRSEPVPDEPDNVRVRVLHSQAHPQGIFVYRIEHGDKAIVFATDVEGYVGGDQRLIRFAQGADLLIHDAQYTMDEYSSSNSSRQGWGHSTWQMAVAVAKGAGAKQLALTHHEPLHSDKFLKAMELEAQAQFPKTVLAYEGLTIQV